MTAESRTWKKAYDPYEGPDCSKINESRIQKQEQQLQEMLNKQGASQAKLPEIARRELGEECGR